MDTRIFIQTEVANKGNGKSNRIKNAAPVNYGAAFLLRIHTLKTAFPVVG